MIDGTATIQDHRDQSQDTVRRDDHQDDRQDDRQQQDDRQDDRQQSQDDQQQQDDRRQQDDQQGDDSWRKGMLGEKATQAELDRAARFANPRAVWDFAINAEKKLSERRPEALKPPGKDATDEQRREWREAYGVPESVDGYTVELPDGVQIGEEDQPIVDGFLKDVALEAGLNNDQVNRAMGWWNRLRADEGTALKEMDDNHYKTSMRELREDWSVDVDRNIDSIFHMFSDASEKVVVEKPNGEQEEISVEQALLGARMENGRKIGGDATMLRALARVGLQLLPAGSEVPDGETRGSLDDRLNEIRELRRKDPEAYERNKPLQAEELKLIESRLQREQRNRRQGEA